MSTAREEAQSAVDRYRHLRSRVETLEAKDRAGTATPADAAFLNSFRRQLHETALEVVHAKMASGEWQPERIIERMSA